MAKVAEVTPESVVRTASGVTGVVIELGNRRVIANRKTTIPANDSDEVAVIIKPRTLALDYAHAHQWPTVSKPIATVDRNSVIVLANGNIATVGNSDPVARRVEIYVTDHTKAQRQYWVSWITEVFVIKTPEDLASEFIWSHMIQPLL